MKKGYQGDEHWTAVSPATGKREIVDPEGEFISGETITKLYYCKPARWLRDGPGGFTLQSRGYSLNPLS